MSIGPKDTGVSSRCAGNLALPFCPTGVRLKELCFPYAQHLRLNYPSTLLVTCRPCKGRCCLASIVQYPYEQQDMAAQEYHIVGTDPIGTGTSQSLSTYGRACPPRKPVAISFEDQNNNLIEASHNSQEGSLTKVAAQNGAKTLRRPGQQVFVGVLIDVCLANLPCAFIALGFIAVYLDDQPISSYGRMVEESARLGPTIFPIAFAAIVARFTKHLARWQAERGQRLGVCG